MKITFLYIYIMTKDTFLYKYHEFILFIGLILWMSIFHIIEAGTPKWSLYFYSILILSINLLPVLVFAFNKSNFLIILSKKQYISYWLLSFFLLLPSFTAFCISLAPKEFDSSFFITSSVAIVVLELVLILNNYFQKKVRDAKWLKKIGFEKSVLISLILISLVISIMAVSSLNHPSYHFKDRLLIGFEFSLTKIVTNFGTFVLFFSQFLFMYLCGYLFFIINSRVLVSYVLKQKGLILYVLSVLTTIVMLYPIIAQILISLPINKTLGRNIFSSNAFDLDNAFGVFAVMLFSLPIVLALQWGKQNNHILSLEKEKSQTELDLLKQQLNPHFFFNTLNNLYGLSLQHSDQTSDSILRLAELMRYTIYKGQHDRVPLTQELDYIDDYIQLQQIRLKEPLNFSFEKHIDDKHLQIAPLLLIVLVENAFKHGVEPSEGKATLNLHLKSDQNKLYFSCENTIEDLDSKKVSGIGLSNLKKRLALVYPNHHTLKIIQIENRYIAELEITL